jgi:hypothetical protein
VENLTFQAFRILAMLLAAVPVLLAAQLIDLALQ